MMAHICTGLVVAFPIVVAVFYALTIRNFFRKADDRENLVGEGTQVILDQWQILRQREDLFSAQGDDESIWWHFSVNPALLVAAVSEQGNQDNLNEKQHFLCNPWTALSLRKDFSRLAHSISLPSSGGTVGACSLQIGYAHSEAAVEILKAWVRCGKGWSRNRDRETITEGAWNVTMQAVHGNGVPIGAPVHWVDARQESYPENGDCDLPELSTSIGPEGLRRPPLSFQDSVRLPLDMESIRAFPAEAVLEVAQILSVRQVATMPGRSVAGVSVAFVQSAATQPGLYTWHVLQQPGKRACVDAVVAMALLDLEMPGPLPAFRSHLQDTKSVFERALRKHTEIHSVNLGTGGEDALNALEAFFLSKAPRPMTCAVAVDLWELGGHAVLFDGGNDGGVLWVRDPFHGWRVRLSRTAMVQATLSSTESAICIEAANHRKLSVGS